MTLHTHALICKYHSWVCFHHLVFSFQMTNDSTERCIAGLVDQMISFPSPILCYKEPVSVIDCVELYS